MMKQAPLIPNAVIMRILEKYDEGSRTDLSWTAFLEGGIDSL
jgi:hypothetical protein